MAPQAQTLALLAMTVGTVAIKVVPLDMAKDSFDDQYLNCSFDMTRKLLELQSSDFSKDSFFANTWGNAVLRWKDQGSVSSPLTPDQAIALMAYSMDTSLYYYFDMAVRMAGSSSQKYRDEFHFKSLHFLLTQALQMLRRPNDCRDVFWGVWAVQFEVKEGDQVRFGQFALMSLSERVAQGFGYTTIFKVHTCHGVDIQQFSKQPEEKAVLIPPFETFRVTAVRDIEGRRHIELHSTGTFSNYECEWLKDGSLPRTSPNFWELLLVTMAMAAVSGAL